SCALAEELQLCRYVSFVDFVDLLKFGQIRFEKESRTQHPCVARKISEPPYTNHGLHRNRTPVSIPSIETLFWQDRTFPEPQQDRFLLQSWSLANEAGPHYWKGCQELEQCVAIISNVKALAE